MPEPVERREVVVGSTQLSHLDGARADATIPSLATWAERFLGAVDVDGPLTVGGHDIGGAVAQHLAAWSPSAERLVRMNSVLYDSWPVPAVERLVRSWTAMAAAADARYTLELMDRLRDRALPTLLVWGEQDEFQPVAFAERYAAEVPGARLVGIPGARQIPTVDEPRLVAEALAGFLAGPGVR